MFASTREEALERLGAFSSKASRYSRERNHVVPGHTNVSRLSPAIRHRMISETEVAKTVLARYAFSTVEKFLQEVYWRRYWKSWLAMRPQVWVDYLSDLERLREGPEFIRSVEVSSGRGPVAVMNSFCRELVETGYLHNHARMWFAGYWIHAMGLPWQLGADFFYRNLLDADPASNTLSWRWVAGLQTQGKVYLARRSNIEKYLHSDLLVGNEEGLELLEKRSVVSPGSVARIPPHESVRDPDLTREGPTGLWVHEEDLGGGDLGSEYGVKGVLISGDMGSWKKRAYSEVKQNWLGAALTDAQERYEKRYEGKFVRDDSEPMVARVTQWAQENGLARVMVYRPEVGLINDQIPGLRAALGEHDIALTFVDRPEDQQIGGYGREGFFSFWKKIEPYVRSLKSS